MEYCNQFCVLRFERERERESPRAHNISKKEREREREINMEEERVRGITRSGGEEEEIIISKRKTEPLTSMSMSRSFRLRSPSLNKVRLRRVFDMFDKNGDGVITGEEISQALVLLGLDADPSELGSMINSFVKPGYAGLVFDDFEAFHQSLNQAYFSLDAEDPQQQPEDEQQEVDTDLKEAFKVFDEDGDGFISAQELQAVLSKLGLPEAQQELPRIQLMISSFDHNHDGLVDFFEFKHMMLRSVLLVPS